MKKKDFFYLCMAIVLIPSLAYGTMDKQEKNMPNIIYFLVDDLGWGDLECYGNLFVKTPHINKMAEEGMLFEQFYVNAPLCSPSRAALITGQFPARNGIHYWMGTKHNKQYGMPEFLDTSRITIQELFQQAGYSTAHFGKWHLGHHEDAPVSLYEYDEVDFIWGGIGPNHGIRANHPQGTEMLVDRSVKFMKNCLEKEMPFYINLWLRDVHAALDPSDESLARYKHLMSQREFKTGMQIYYAAITEMDFQLGRLIKWIDSQPGLAENTIIVFTSDNGPEDPYIPHCGHHAVGLPGPFRGRKRSLYEGGLRVPFIIKWKGTIPEGLVDNQSVISSVDILPTFCSLSGIKTPENYLFDGEDVSKLFYTGKPHIRKKALYWEWRFDGVGQCLNRSPMLAIRDGKWKLLMNPDKSRVELYNIPEQPMELHSVAYKHPRIVKKLCKKVLNWQNELPKGPVTDKPGSDEYPGYPENAGRGPVMDSNVYKKILSPVKVNIMREDVLND